MYRSTKTYGHELGLSACFRQWRAESHCRFIHGYALAFRFEFGCKTLDRNGWVVDFGALKPLKEMLVNMFDHKLLVARDDPNLFAVKTLENMKLAEIAVIDRVGCEAFARLAHEFASIALAEMPDCRQRQLHVVSAECKEHGANSAIYIGE